MKTSAIVAQLFEPTTAQTAKSSSASAGSAADFSKMVASVRGQGMFFSPQDASQLVTAPAERPVAPEARQTPPRADQPVKPRPQAAAAPARSTDKPQPARDTQSAPTADSATVRQSSTNDAAAKPVADDNTSPADDQTATDSTAVVPVVADTAPPETLPASVPALALLSNIASAEGTDTTSEAPSGADGSAVEAILAATSSQTQGASAASGNTAANAPQQAQRQNQQQQQTALDAAQAANAQTASADGSAVPQDAGSVLKAAAAAVDDKGASTSAPQQGQAADLASLAAGAGLTVKSGNDRPSSLPQSSLVSGAMMAQSVDGEAAAAAANAGNPQNGDAAFLAKGEAQATFANAMNGLGQAPAAQGARPFAAAMEAVAGPSTTAATSSAPAAAPPIAGIGATNTTLASGATGIAQTATPARGPQMAAPLQQLSSAMANAALKGQDSISIQLSPGDLGKVDVKLDFSGDHVTAAISAEKPETLDLLQKDSRALEKMLGDAGLQTNQQSLSFSLQGQQNQNTQTSAREERSSRSRAQLLSIDDAAPTTATQSRARTTVGGIDISV